MRALILLCGVLLLSLATAACTPSWKRAGGAETLPALAPSSSAGPASAEGPAKERQASRAAPSRRVALALPDGWSWTMRGDDLLATRDGVFLQHLLVERIPIGQAVHSSGPLPEAAFSAEQWPLRTARYLPKRFRPGMSPEDAAEVLFESRRNNPGIIDLVVRKVTTRTIAGYPGFRAVYDFRVTVLPRRTLYRTIYCGILRDGWFYGISYTAALRQYFNRDSDTFEAVLQSFRIIGE